MANTLPTLVTLLRSAAVVSRRFDAELGSLHGVGMTDYAILSCLADAPGGRLRRVDLAKALGLSASGVTRALVPLERIGLAQREKDAVDARIAYASITEAGRWRLAQIGKTATQAADDAFAADVWDADRIECLRRMLTDLVDGAVKGPGPG